MAFIKDLMYYRTPAYKMEMGVGERQLNIERKKN